MRKFYVWRLMPGVWRFSNLSTIGGDCATWAEAWAEACSLAYTAEPTA